MKLELRFVQREIDRHGNERFYFRRGRGKRVRLPGVPGAPDFIAAYHAALEGPAAPKGDVKDGTFRWLVTHYLASTKYGGLDTKTRATRRLLLEHCCREPITPGSARLFADMPLRFLDAAAVMTLRDRKGAALPHAANDRLKAVKALLSWAVKAQLIAANPARDVERLAAPTKGHHSWTVEEVRQFEEKHPVGSKARLALALLLYTGQRRSDIVLFGKQHVRDGWLSFTQRKNRNRKPVALELPVLAELQEVIDASPIGNLTFLVTEKGAPFTGNGFGNKFREWCDDAGLPHCSAHGVRKAAAALAAENGATENQLMAIFGWISPQEAARYTKAARQKRIARSAITLLKRNEGETK